MSAPDTKQPIFDPGMDVATVVFSHVRCVKTRVTASARVSKLWRDASKPAAAYPRTFDFDAFRQVHSMHAYGAKFERIIRMLDNDEALSLPYERVVGLLGEAARFVRFYVTTLLCRGSVRLLKWTRVNNRAWGTHTCYSRSRYGHLPALKYLHENGCPWDGNTCFYAAERKHWDCFQYSVDNKCPGWEIYAEKYAKHLR